MNLLKYKSFIYFGYLVSTALICLPWFLSDKLSATLLVATTGLVSLVVFLFSKGKTIPKFEYIPQRVTVLVTFLLYVFLSFAHYLTNFTEEKSLVILVYTTSILTLLTLIFTSFEEDKN